MNAQANRRSPRGGRVHRLRFDDFDACKEALQEWDLEAVQLDRGPFRGELMQAESAGVLVSEATFGRKLHQTGEPPRGRRTVVVPAGGSQRISWRNHRVAGDDVMLFPRGCALDAASAPGFHVLTISFPEDLVSERARVLEGRDYEDLLAGREVLRGTPAQIWALRQAAARFGRPSAGSRSAETGRLEHDDGVPGLHLLDVLIETLDHFEEAPRPLQDRKRDVALRRSLGLIESRPREALSVTDLCRASEASRRTLEYAYRERFGVSPKTYLLSRRLDGVRRELRNRDPAQLITRVANRWGFHHLSQFAALYARQFGELPSETLRATASSSRQGS